MLKRVNTFSFEYYSEIEKKNYDGKFTARIANFADKQKISTRAAQLCGGMYCVRDDEGLPTGRGVDEMTESNARTIAWLETILVQKPEWFKLDDPENGIIDEELVWSVFREVRKFELRFRGGERPTTEGADGSAQSSEGTSAPESPKADAGNAPTKVVGREVQAALDT